VVSDLLDIVAFGLASAFAWRQFLLGCRQKASSNHGVDKPNPLSIASRAREGFRRLGRWGDTCPKRELSSVDPAPNDAVRCGRAERQ
jgi:hypothetical protein